MAVGTGRAGGGGVHTTVASTLAISLVLVPVVARLGELLIRQWTRVRVESARQRAAVDTILAMPPGSLAVVQQPDGTVSVLVRTPVVDGEAGAGPGAG
jgi:hypothetical protein